MATFVSALTFNRIGTSKLGVGVDALNNNDNKLLPLRKKKSTHEHGPLVVRATAREDANAAANTVRREILVGGAAGALSAAVNCHTAKAAPVPPPNLNVCGASIGRSPGQAIVEGVPLVFRNCCPPSLAPDKKTINFQPDKGVLRIRQPLHKAVQDEDFLSKYHEAYRRMRELKDSDPRSMTQQANVHCAYCNDAYRPSIPDASNPTKRLQIHFGWFFLPWHRFYLYFHEKILGSLIDDPTFALPYWNWDNQYPSDKANTIPGVFNEKDLWPAIYDANRDQARYTQIVNLNMRTIGAPGDPQENLNVMRTSVADVRSQELFFGKPYRFGSDTPGLKAQGTLEQAPHTALHVFVGDPRNPLREDMGNFYSAGRDPLFYLHHSNVDRMWTVWKTLDSGNVDFTDTDYLESEFLFFDENQNLVKCKVKDAADTVSSFKYTFAPAPDSQWIGHAPPVANTFNLQAAAPPAAPAEVKNGEPLVFKVDLPDAQSLAGARDVALVIKGVSVPMEEGRSFNVFINLPQATVETKVDCAEFVGTWINVPHLMGTGGEMETKLDITFSIRTAIAQLKLSGSVTVSLVPTGEYKDAPFTILGAGTKIFSA